MWLHSLSPAMLFHKIKSMRGQKKEKKKKKAFISSTYDFSQTATQQLSDFVLSTNPFRSFPLNHWNNIKKMWEGGEKKRIGQHVTFKKCCLLIIFVTKKSNYKYIYQPYKRYHLKFLDHRYMNT